MSYYCTCPICGANLDPGERCDCETEREARSKQGQINFSEGEPTHEQN